MARRGKYGLDKRLKELKKKKKRDEKLERKRMKKQGAQNDSEESQEAPVETTDEDLEPDGESKEREDQQA